MKHIEPRITLSGKKKKISFDQFKKEFGGFFIRDGNREENMLRIWEAQTGRKLEDVSKNSEASKAD